MELELLVRGIKVKKCKPEKVGKTNDWIGLKIFISGR